MDAVAIAIVSSALYLASIIFYGIVLAAAVGKNDTFKLKGSLSKVIGIGFYLGTAGMIFATGLALT